MPWLQAQTILTIYKKHMTFNHSLLLIKRHLLKDGKKAFLAIAGGWLLFVFLMFVFQWFRPSINLEIYHTGMVVFFLFGGAVLGSIIFNESSQISSGFQYSILPVSVFHKLTAATVITIPILWALLLALYFLGLGIFSLLASTGVNFTELTYNFVDGNKIQAALMGSCFGLLGGAWFKTYPTIKTALLANAVAAVFITIMAIVAFKLSPIGYMQKNVSETVIWEFNSTYIDSGFGTNIASYIVTTVIALFFLLVAYYKLKERSI
jgi:hypothetical protein